MPWFQEISLAAARANTIRRPERIGFFEGISTRSADDLLRSFAAAPVIDDPRAGRIDTEAAFLSYVAATRERANQQGGFNPIALTRTKGRSVEEVSIELAGDNPDLFVAIAADLVADGRIRGIRVYYSMWP
ncbi:MAG: hypothetical protein JOZ73_06060 [Solirubrobacterales bacterium]|nr:hypothetical protein [Solirubrobacterales bacterium]